MLKRSTYGRFAFGLAHPQLQPQQQRPEVFMFTASVHSQSIHHQSNFPFIPKALASRTGAPRWHTQGSDAPAPTLGFLLTLAPVLPEGLNSPGWKHQAENTASRGCLPIPRPHSPSGFGGSAPRYIHRSLSLLGGRKRGITEWHRGQCQELWPKEQRQLLGS